jgi:hypothetical protein
MGWAEGVKFASTIGQVVMAVGLLGVGAMALQAALGEAIAGGKGSQLNGELTDAD